MAEKKYNVATMYAAGDNLTGLADAYDTLRDQMVEPNLGGAFECVSDAIDTFDRRTQKAIANQGDEARTLGTVVPRIAKDLEAQDAAAAKSLQVCYHESVTTVGPALQAK